MATGWADRAMATWSRAEADRLGVIRVATGAGPDPAPDLPPLALPGRKALRAAVIAQHALQAGDNRLVCFTCGHAARALEAVGLDVVAIGPGEALRTVRWWTPGAVARAFPGRFDATPGHLPLPLLLDYARTLFRAVGALPLRAYAVPTGSGETIVALRLVYPDTIFVPVYDSGPTAYDAANPLNAAAAYRGPGDYPLRLGRVGP